MTAQAQLDPGMWDEAIASVDGPQLVVGGPGSGKTEFLVRRVIHLVGELGVDPGAIVVVSFSRRSAADLRRRIGAGLDRSLSRLPVATFHSLSHRLLEAHGSAGDWGSVPALLTGPEHVALVAELLADEDPGAWPLPFRALLADPSFADEVADFQLRAAERLIDPGALSGMDRAEWRALPGFLARYREALVDRGRIDYGSLQAEAVALLDDPEVRQAAVADLEFVLVDEYQDTTVAQARLLSALAPHGNLTAAGDPYQSIFSFRGAELGNVAEFPDRFRSPDGTPARRIVLTTSFRVPARILDAAVTITSGAGLPGAAGPMQPAGPGGSVETYAFDQHSAEADWIAGEIQRMHLRDRIPYSRMAVVVRSKRGFLSEVSRALDRRRVPHDRPDTRLVDHPAVHPILDLVRAAREPTGADLRRVLLGPLVELTVSGAREIERHAAADGWSPAVWQDAVPEPVAALLADDEWAHDLPAADGLWAVWSTVDAFVPMVTDPARAGDRRAMASLAQALTRLAERDPSASLADFAAMSESEDFEATPLLEYEGDHDRVALTTLHQSKGMTFDVVFIADAREGVLPDLRSRDSVLGTRHLSPTHGGDDTAYAEFRLQEEMRLAYSAMCRATTRVVWTCTTTGFEGGEGVPSRFLPLVAGVPMDEATNRPSAWTAPTTPTEAEAWLRRRIADPRLTAVERLAAAAATVDDAAWRPRPPQRFAGTRTRGPATGLVGPDEPLSASQADAYTQCPRRYAFERRLGIDSGGSKYQELGSLVHEVLEVAERTASERGDEHAELDDVLELIDERFAPERFDGGAWAEAWLERARRMVTRLYEQWPGYGAGTGFELEFDFEHVSTRWRGRIDRVERRGDALHIVDYKTGTSVPTTSEAAHSIQLGLYLRGLQAISDEPVGGAEFWYPAYRPDGASVTVRSLDLDLIDDVDDALAAAAAGIRDEDWRAVPNERCDRCPVRLVCPEWPEGQEAFTG